MLGLTNGPRPATLSLIFGIVVYFLRRRMRSFTAVDALLRDTVLVCRRPVWLIRTQLRMLSLHTILTRLFVVTLDFALTAWPACGT